MISARQTTNRQSFKKVTCPFKHSFYPFSSRKAYLRSLVGLVACWLRNSRIWQWWHDMTCHNGWPCVLPKSLIKITSNDNDNNNSKIKESYMYSRNYYKTLSLDFNQSPPSHPCPDYFFVTLILIWGDTSSRTKLESPHGGFLHAVLVRRLSKLFH